MTLTNERLSELHGLAAKFITTPVGMGLYEALSHIATARLRHDWTYNHNANGKYICPTCGGHADAERKP